LAQSESPSGVTQLGKRLQLTKSNVHRLLQTLASQGYVRNRDSEGRYELTLKLWEVGSQALSRLDIKQVAAPRLKALAEGTSETVHLSLLDDGEVIYIDKIDSPHPVRAYSRIGGRAPAYCVATGKAMLAYSPDSTINLIGVNLKRYSSTTICSLRDLKKEFSGVRKNGYAINRGEWREGVCGIAAPIFDSTNRVIAAIGLSGPADRLKMRTLKKFSPLVTNAAAGISRELGYPGTL
jgi:DNA-binding IclR family transcriptional regulator